MKKPDPVSPEIRDFAVLYSAGLLDEEEARVFEAWLRGSNEAATAELQAFQETAAQLSFALPEEKPDRELRTRLLERIRAEESEPIPGIHVKRTSSEGFRPTPYPGVTYKPLYVDRATDMATSLLRMEPGARYPKHRHAAAEQCLVIEGEVSIGQLVLRAGDFEWAEAETIHSVLETRHGCVLLIVASRRDEVLG